MPVVYNQSFGNNTHLVLWHITEPVAQLEVFIQGRLLDPDTVIPIHSSHWLASRACLLHFFENHKLEIKKDVFNKPSLLVNEEPYHLSISHSYAYAAVLFSNTHHVALDLEKYDDRIERVKHKFCHDSELEFATSQIQLTKIWSSKETLYKYYGQKEVDFKSHLLLQAFEPDALELSGSINKPGYQIALPVKVKQLDGYCLTYIIA